MGFPWVRRDFSRSENSVSLLLRDVCNLHKPPSLPPSPAHRFLGAPLLPTPTPHSGAYLLGLGCSWEAQRLPSFPATPNTSAVHLPIPALIFALPGDSRDHPPRGVPHFQSRCSGQWQQPRLLRKSGGQIGRPALSGVPGPLSVTSLFDTPTPSPPGFQLRVGALPSPLCS